MHAGGRLPESDPTAVLPRIEYPIAPCSMRDLHVDEMSRPRFRDEMVAEVEQRREMKTRQ